ncbi:MAG: YkgJ family cysteine cluster protein [Verrucomicrobia bacterium]|nr:YkgJ family cysteine cluster protein [Verrucomicrobiota bacterium]
MFSPAIEKQRQQLYAHTVEQMEQRLHGVTEAAPAFAALRWGMEAIDRAYETTPAKIRAQVACRAGCGHCCQVAVDVQAHEVFFAAEFIQVNFSPEALAEVVARTAARRATLAAEASAGQRERFMQTCALLRDGSCSIYAGRPEACRAHHASDASVCAAHIADASVDLTKVYVPPLRARLFAVMLGMDEAIEAEGFDDRAYDFGAALHEALTNSLCLALWLRRKPAFPDSCLADGG